MIEVHVAVCLLVAAGRRRGSLEGATRVHDSSSFQHTHTWNVGLGKRSSTGQTGVEKPGTDLRRPPTPSEYSGSEARKIEAAEAAPPRTDVPHSVSAEVRGANIVFSWSQTREPTGAYCYAEQLANAGKSHIRLPPRGTPGVHVTDSWMTRNRTTADMCSWHPSKRGDEYVCNDNWETTATMPLSALKAGETYLFRCGVFAWAAGCCKVPGDGALSSPMILRALTDGSIETVGCGTGGDWEQLRLAAGAAAGSVVVSWAQAPAEVSQIIYTRAFGGELTRVQVPVRTSGASSVRQKRPLGLVHVLLSGLDLDTWYFLQPQGKGCVHPIMLRSRGAIAVVADLGFPTPVVTPALSALAAEHRLAGIMHAGDIAYSLRSLSGTVGDRYLRMMQPAVASVPYMIAPGDHDARDWEQARDVVGRFAMPGWDRPMADNTPDGAGLWWSVDIGAVHIASFSTELWKVRGVLPRVWHWLREDLKKADANRAQVPWIVTMAHQPMYTSARFRNSPGRVDSRSGPRWYAGEDKEYPFNIEGILHDHSVDVAFWGHFHHYERSVPLFDTKPAVPVSKSSKVNATFPKGISTVHVNIGAAGRGFEPFRSRPFNGSAVRSSQTGFGMLSARGHAALEFAFHRCSWEACTGETIDSFELVAGR